MADSERELPGFALDWPGETQGSAGDAEGGDLPSVPGQAPEPPDEYEQLTSVMGALPEGTQVALQRVRPTWASGHVETIVLGRGENIDLLRMDGIRRLHGGGVFKFKPLGPDGRFIRGVTRTLEIDGPPLHHGQPHPKDPQRPVHRPDVVQVQHQPAYPPAPYGGPSGLSTARDPVGVLEQFMGRMMDRVDSLERALTAPSPNPVDPNQSILAALKLVKEIEAFGRRNQDDEEDWEEEEEEEEDFSMNGMVAKLLEQKMRTDLAEDAPPTAGPPPATNPTPPPAKQGPRLIRAGETEELAPSSASSSSPSSVSNPVEMLAAFAAMSAADQAATFKAVGDSLPQETLSELQRIMPPAGPEAAE